MKKNVSLSAPVAKKAAARRGKARAEAVAVKTNGGAKQAGLPSAPDAAEIRRREEFDRKARKILRKGGIRSQAAVVREIHKMRREMREEQERETRNPKRQELRRA